MLMETISRWIGGVNDVLWTYVLVAALLGCAVWFTLRTRGVQFRLLGEMMRVLGESAGSGPKGERHVSSFQAFAVSLASRVGTGNLAGVATAIVVGGPGAVFWMWVIALVGAASAFVESTLAQLYKRRGRDSFIGGLAYYMERGLGRRWMGVLFAVLISVTFGFAFNSVQSNTICAAWEGAFGADHVWVGVVLTALTLLIIFGGIRRIARVSGVIVPIMALGYIVLALGVVLFNLGRLPEVLELIVADAFGWEQTLGGAVGAAFEHALEWATETRQEQSWTLYFLPLVGVFIAFWYSKMDMPLERGTNFILTSVRQDHPVWLRLAPSIFITSVLTHLCGGSAGREGAALQLGGAISGNIGHLMHLDDKDSRTITMCGMAACLLFLARRWRLLYSQWRLSAWA